MNDPLMRLGRLAKQGPSDDQVSQRIERVRTRFRESFDQAHTSPRPTLPLFAGALTVAAVVCGTFFWWSARERPLEAFAEAQSGELTGESVSSGQGTKQIQFSDGTRLSLHPGTVVHVEGTTSRGATLQLREGRAFATIVPSDEAQWLIEAGPYAVHVTGTEFELSWDPSDGELELAMHRGSVVLTGPNVPGKLTVQGSEFVRFRVAERAEEPPEQEASRREAPERGAPEQEAAKDAEIEETNGVRGEARSGSGSVGSDAGEPAKAPRSARLLWDLVQEARQRRDGDGARSALLELRSRHGARGQTAYLLGRVHADELGSPAEAIHWFEMYLKEAPGGSLSEQALGRLIELQAGTAAGRKAAQRYLDRYPHGSYARLARSSSQ